LLLFGMGICKVNLYFSSSSLEIPMTKGMERLFMSLISQHPHSKIVELALFNKRSRIVE
jgi:hypothetical protein